MSSGPVGSGSVGGRPLSNDAVFRIEVSLSSRRSSAIVMRTAARLYILEGAQATPGSKVDAEWKSVAYGAPCIQLTRESTEHNSPFHIKLVIAEVESGISLWETELDQTSKYNAMQNNFHTFSAIGKTFAVQFANNDEASRMLESLKDLFEQKQKAETVSFDKKPSEAIFKKPKSLRKINKKDISAPCNFKHVSGITLNRTQTCEDELRGTIQRKMRSMSLSNLSRKRANADLAERQQKQQYRELDVSPSTMKKIEAGGSLRTARSGSLLQKFGSLRLTKKKPYSSVPVKIKGEIPTRTPGGYTNGTGGQQGGFMRDERRQSLPAHVRRQARPQLGNDTFVAPGGRTDRQQSPLRSFSTDDLVTSPTGAYPPRRASTLERRHTVLGPTSPRRQSTSGQFNYTPYVENQPYPNGRHGSATGLNYPSSQYPQQMQQQYYRNGGAPLSSRPFVSDMSLNRNAVVNPYPMAVPRSAGPYVTAPPQAQQYHPRGVSWAPAAMSSSVGHLQMTGVAGPPRPQVAGGRRMSAEQLHYQQQQQQYHYTQRVPPSVNGDVGAMVPQSSAGVTHTNGPVLQSPVNQQQPQQFNVASTSTAAVAPVSRSDDPKPYATVGIGSQPQLVKNSGPPQPHINPTLSSAVPTQNIPQPATVALANGTIHTSPTHSTMGQNRPRDVVTTTANGSHYDVLNPKRARNMPLPPTPDQYQQQAQPSSQSQAVSSASTAVIQNTHQPPPVSQMQPAQQQQGPMKHWSQMGGANMTASYPMYTKPPSPNLRQYQRYAKSTSPGIQRRAETNVSMTHAQVVPAAIQNGHFKQLTHPIPVKGPVIPQARMGQLSPKKNSPKFQPNSTQAYDTLPSGPNEGDDPGNRDSLATSSAVSLTEELSQYTEQMSKALEQFDSLLQPQSKRQIMQTSL